MDANGGRGHQRWINAASTRTAISRPKQLEQTINCRCSTAAGSRSGRIQRSTANQDMELSPRSALALFGEAGADSANALASLASTRFLLLSWRRSARAPPVRSLIKVSNHSVFSCRRSVAVRADGALARPVGTNRVHLQSSLHAGRDRPTRRAQRLSLGLGSDAPVTFLGAMGLLGTANLRQTANAISAHVTIFGLHPGVRRKSTFDPGMLGDATIQLARTKRRPSGSYLRLVPSSNVG